MIRVLHGDCREVLPTLDAGSFDACVCDPPYELGFMGRKWDKTGVAFRPETWRAVYDVLKPGAHMLAFSGTRTYHRMVCAIEDAGFEIRDHVAWVYGSGFSKAGLLKNKSGLEWCGCDDKTSERILRSVRGSDVSEAEEPLPRRQ